MCNRVCQFKSLVILLLVLASLIAPCLFAAQAKNSPPADSFRKEMVMLDVVVTDKKNQLVKNLKAEHFTVFDDKVKQPIHFFSAEEKPVSVGVLLDVSGSMRFQDSKPKERPIDVFKTYLQPFLEHGHPSNEYFLMSFGAQSQLVCDWTRDKKLLLDNVNKISTPKGATAFFDAFLQALEKTQAGANKRRAIIVLSDGRDSISKQGYNDVKRLMKQSDVRVYPVTVVDLNITYSLYGVNHVPLREMAELTGGTYFVASGATRLAYALDQILDEFKHQYTIGYAYPTKLDNRWHSVKVEIAPLEIKDSAKPDKPAEKVKPSTRTRQGYYAK